MFVVVINVFLTKDDRTWRLKHWLKGGRSYSIQGCGRGGLAVLNGNEFCLYDQCSQEDELQVA